MSPLRRRVIAELTEKHGPYGFTKATVDARVRELAAEPTTPPPNPKTKPRPAPRGDAPQVVRAPDGARIVLDGETTDAEREAQGGLDRDLRVAVRAGLDPKTAMTAQLERTKR